MERIRSKELFERATRHLVGGVNSPVRAFRGVGGTPLFLESGRGPRITDVDGNEYIDYVMSWGPLILGHAHPEVVSAIAAQALRGTSFGAPCALEIELAELVTRAYPSVEKIRFVSSGTEATMSALRLARGATGKDGIVKCEGCYHGHADSLLVKAGSGVSTLGLPDSPGVPGDLARHTFNVPFNDHEALAQLLDEVGHQVACVILEPVAGNMGCVPPLPGYLEKVRELCTRHGVLLIFDEVMTGFRVALGGAQERYGVAPDITCFGKVIGGGLPVGAFGASRSLMAKLAPEGAIYQAGTLSGNPLAMAAGLATLRPLFEDGVYTRLSTTAMRVAEGMAEAARAVGFPASSTSAGSMFSLFLRDRAPHDYDTVKEADKDRFARFFWLMLDRGVYLAPSAFEAGFVSLAHGEEEIDATLAAARDAFATLRAHEEA
ncbi:MAG: glutamate-1-semialdehyde 2,1-aminomutase [Myxococcota bacterium]